MASFLAVGHDQTHFGHFPEPFWPLWAFVLAIRTRLSASVPGWLLRLIVKRGSASRDHESRRRRGGDTKTLMRRGLHEKEILKAKGLPGLRLPRSRLFGPLCPFDPLNPFPPCDCRDLTYALKT